MKAFIVEKLCVVLKNIGEEKALAIGLCHLKIVLCVSLEIVFWKHGK